MKGGITIHDEEPLPLEESGEGIRKVATNLEHPCGVGIRRDAGTNHFPCRPFHHEQHVVSHQATFRPNFDRREVNRGKPGPLRLQESRPRRPAAAFAADSPKSVFGFAQLLVGQKCGSRPDPGRELQRFELKSGLLGRGLVLGFEVSADANAVKPSSDSPGRDAVAV